MKYLIFLFLCFSLVVPSQTTEFFSPNSFVDKDRIEKIKSTFSLVEKMYSDHAVKNHFHGEVEQVDFSDASASSKKINDWVLVKTNNKIKDLIPASSINNLTRLILVNAIYFKGNWMQKFDVIDTSKEDFNCADGSKVKVEMMKLRGKKFKILDNVFDRATNMGNELRFSK